jgi:AcrR family transcriptional regulator
VQAIAAELGLGRTTIYRWFASRDGLLGEVLYLAAEPEAALRIITSGSGAVQPRIVARITELIEGEARAGAYGGVGSRERVRKRRRIEDRRSR